MKIGKAISYAALLIVVNSLIALPVWIPIGNSTLMNWQREHLEWNYIGAGFLYMVFLLYSAGSRQRIADYGVKLGSWRKEIRWFAIVTGFLLIMARIMDYAAAGKLVILVPALSTTIFQLIVISLGEELIYRGIIQTNYGLWPAVFAFAFTHGIGPVFSGMPFSLELFSFAAILGLLFGLIRNKTDSVLACALCHGLYNILNHIVVAG